MQVDSVETLKESELKWRLVLNEVKPFNQAAWLVEGQN